MKSKSIQNPWYGRPAHESSTARRPAHNRRSYSIVLAIALICLPVLELQAAGRSSRSSSSRTGSSRSSASRVSSSRSTPSRSVSSRSTSSRGALSSRGATSGRSSNSRVVRSSSSSSRQSAVSSRSRASSSNSRSTSSRSNASRVSPSRTTGTSSRRTSYKSTVYRRPAEPATRSTSTRVVRGDTDRFTGARTIRTENRRPETITLTDRARLRSEGRYDADRVVSNSRVVTSESFRNTDDSAAFRSSSYRHDPDAYRHTVRDLSYARRYGSDRIVVVNNSRHGYYGGHHGPTVCNVVPYRHGRHSRFSFGLGLYWPIYTPVYYPAYCEPVRTVSVKHVYYNTDACDNDVYYDDYGAGNDVVDYDTGYYEQTTTYTGPESYATYTTYETYYPAWSVSHIYRNCVSPYTYHRTHYYWDRWQTYWRDNYFPNTWYGALWLNFRF